MAPLATKQPFKALYIAQRTLSSLALIPFWYLKYLHVSARPRTSWTALEAVVVRFIRRMIYMNEATGIMLDRTDKTKQVDDSTLKETSFVWLDAVDESLVHGIAKNEDVKPVRIPGYIWPKGAKVEEAEGYVGYWVCTVASDFEVCEAKLRCEGARRCISVQLLGPFIIPQLTTLQNGQWE